MLSAQVSMCLLVEHDLWVNIAGQDRIPYPCVYDALRFLRSADAKPGNASLCDRCGCDE